MALLLSLGKRAGTVSAEKNRKIYCGNRFRNIKNMAGTHFLIRIGNQIGKIGSKKGPEFGIPPEFAEFRSDFPTKVDGGVLRLDAVAAVAVGMERRRGGRFTILKGDSDADIAFVFLFHPVG